MTVPIHAPAFSEGALPSDLERLENFLLSAAVSDEAMTLPELDGFLTAIAIGPEVIEPEEWLPFVWARDHPRFTSEDESVAIVGAILGRFNDIARNVGEGCVSPIFLVDIDDTPLPEPWAEGFFRGAALRAKEWEPLFLSESNGYAAFPILAFCDDENVNSAIRLTREQRNRMRTKAADLLADAVLDIAEYWRRRLGPSPEEADRPRSETKVGRNERCPCGSGAKYKKCHGRDT